MLSYALLIDGGFIKKKLGSAVAPLNSKGVRDFLDTVAAHSMLKDVRLHRCYWYDAPPLSLKVTKPLQGGDLDFSQTDLGKANTVLLTDLARVPFMSLRLGYCAFRGWKVKAKKLDTKQPSVTLDAAALDPNISQKAVDMRLGIDIASLILKKQVGIIVLVAGDADFVPAMKFARREGAQIFLAPLGHSVRPEMVEHSDCVLDLPMIGATTATSQAGPQTP